MNLINQPNVQIDELQLLYGKPIPFRDICLIYSPTIADIVAIGQERFKELLFLLTSKPSEIVKTEKSEKTINFFVQKADENTDFNHIIKEAFRFFTHEEIIFLPEMQGIQIGKNVDPNLLITDDNYEEFQYILRKICWCPEENSRSNPANEHAARIAKKIADYQKTVSKIKAKTGKDDSIDLSVLVSSLGYKFQNLNYIFQLSYYAFLDQFKRMQYEEEYETNLRSALAGAKIPQDKMKYWIRKIQDDNTGGN